MRTTPWPTRCGSCLTKSEDKGGRERERDERESGAGGSAIRPKTQPLHPNKHATYSPRVTFCGYSIPHPSEAVVNMRVQTTGKEKGREREREREREGDDACRPPTPHDLSIPVPLSPPGEISAAEALRQACVDLKAACGHVSSAWVGTKREVRAGLHSARHSTDPSPPSPLPPSIHPSPLCLHHSRSGPPLRPPWRQARRAPPSRTRPRPCPGPSGRAGRRRRPHRGACDFFRWERETSRSGHRGGPL